MPGNLSSAVWDGTTLGDAGPYSAAEWQNIWRVLFTNGRNNDGIFRDYLNGFAPSYYGSTPNNAINIDSGGALLRGVLSWSNASQSVSFTANASGFSRIDRVVLQILWSTQTASVVVLTGTPAASPAAPALTQTNGVKWEIPLCQVILTNGYTFIAEDDITDEREFIGIPSGVQYLLTNRDGATVYSGQAATVDTANDNSFGSASRHTKAFLGATQGTIANAARGHIIDGPVRAKTDMSGVTRGNFLYLKGTTNEFINYNPLADYAGASVVSAMALETSTSEYVDALVIHRLMQFERFTQFTTTTQYSGNNTAFARVGSGTNWQVTLRHRAAPMFVQCWMVCRNNDPAYSAFFKLYNATAAAYISTQWDLAVIGPTWHVLSFFGVDFAPSVGVDNDYQLHAASSNAAGTWYTRAGHLFARELGH